MKPSEHQADGFSALGDEQPTITAKADAVKPARTTLLDETDEWPKVITIDGVRRCYFGPFDLVGVSSKEFQSCDYHRLIRERDALREALKACVTKMDDLASKLSACRDALPIESPLINLTAFDYQQESEQARAALAP